MDRITIRDLEVHYRVGVTAAERAQPQRLLVSVEMGLDLSHAAARDDLAETIDYHAVCERLRHFGDNRHWALIETVAMTIAQMILDEFHPQDVLVEVKKFVIPQARYVSVTVARSGT